MTTTSNKLFPVFTLLMVVLTANLNTVVGFKVKSFECGPYGFTCEPNNKVRICEGENLIGPSFLCPPNTICNEDSSDVCENTVNYVDSVFTRAIRCHRSERIADPNVPGCKGYILCIPNRNRFQGIKFKCSGNTIFNGYTRTCSAPNKYRCPLSNTTPSSSEFYSENRKINSNGNKIELTNSHSTDQKLRPIECKNYKFSVTQDSSSARATYFCPSKPVRGETTVRCTIFSNQFCITLERDHEDQFIHESGAAYRKPRM